MNMKPEDIEYFEDLELCAEVDKRLKNGNPVWVDADKVLGNTADSENPYRLMSDEELFD